MGTMMPRWVVSVYGATPRWLSSRIVRLVNPSYLIGAVAVVFDDEGRVLTLRHTYHQPPWRLPGGVMDRGEQPQDAAVRETAEEANCVITYDTTVDATTLRYSFDVAVLCQLREVKPFQPNAEVVERQFLPRDQWGRLRADQRRFVERAYPIWKARAGKDS